MTENGDKELAVVWQSQTSDVELRSEQGSQWRKRLAQSSDTSNGGIPPTNSPLGKTRQEHHPVVRFREVQSPVYLCPVARPPPSPPGPFPLATQLRGAHVHPVLVFARPVYWLDDDVPVRPAGVLWTVCWIIRISDFIFWSNGPTQ